MGGIGEAVQAVVGIGGAVAGLFGGDDMDDALSYGQGMYGMARAIDAYFLGGGSAAALDVPGFQDQFAEIDFAVQEQMRNIDKEGRKAQQIIADNIPSGGAKLRALADLAMQVEEQKGKAHREAQARKRELDIQLTNQYLQAAMNRQYTVSPDARMYAAMNQYNNRISSIGALGQGLGSLVGGLAGDSSWSDLFGGGKTDTATSDAIGWADATAADRELSPASSWTPDTDSLMAPKTPQKSPYKFN